VLGKVRFEGFDPSVKYGYFHRFFDVFLCVRLYVEAGPEFFPRMFLRVKAFVEALNLMR